MSQLKKIRESQNLTQEELAEKSGLSVRTIQRIEAGTEPKGYTLKTLATSLNISEKKLLNPVILEDKIDESNIDEKPNLIPENIDLENKTLVKIINLSTLPVAWFPVVNFLPPLILMLVFKQKSKLVKQIVSLQIFMAIISPIIFLLVAFLKLAQQSALITIVLLTLANVYIILRNTYELDKFNKLHYNLNFNII